MPDTPADRVRRVLEFERSVGCTNRGVVGGLEAFLVRMDRTQAWSASVADVLRGYGTMSSSVRARALDFALQAIAGQADPMPVPSAGGRRAVRPTESTFSPSPSVEPKVWERVHGANRPRPEGTQGPPTPIKGVAGATSNEIARAPAGPTGMGRQPRRSPVSRTVATSDVDHISPLSPIAMLPAITPRVADALHKLGINSLQDLIYHLPRRHIDRRSVTSMAALQSGQVATVLVTIVSVARKATSRRGLTVTEAVIRDETAYGKAVWFNQAFLLRRLGETGPVLISGRAEQTASGVMQFASPEVEADAGDSLHAGRLVPFYAKTEGVTDKVMRTAVRQALDLAGLSLVDILPTEVRDSEGLIPLLTALESAHFPADDDGHREAIRRLAFDEFFVIQAGVLQRRYQWQQDHHGLPFAIPPGTLESFVDCLPYTLTGAQVRSIREIERDVRRDTAMARLLQGEVGSGKTAVGAAACLMAVRSGYQVAMMAPTEILAQQHERSLRSMLEPLGVRVARISGSQRVREKREVWAACALGLIDVVVGTHALVQGEGAFQQLGLVIVDEQHRFGVEQRASLMKKGANPHLLVMTATPIPRTLALSIFGDLDQSLLDELPPGRQPIRTILVAPDRRGEAYAFLGRQVHLGRQGFVIFPLVEESEKIEARAATAEYERLQRQFPDLRLALVHGRMSPREKDDVMGRFRDGLADVLVATAVVEVGIDVPNASAILIEGADRFGLAQLHQFRGRVGRGPHASSCLLLTDSDAEVTMARLRALERTADGFALAEEDLRLRGPGQFFGRRQSGLPDLKVASYGDRHVLAAAHRQAGAVLARDPGLAQPRHARLKALVDDFHRRSIGAG